MTHVHYRDMDPCHSVKPRSPAVTSAATVAHLIRNIEQLKNKDKLISQLEKDLGHQWAAVQFAALERTQGEGAEATASEAPSHPPGALPEGRPDPDSFSWTPTSTPTPGDVEDERSAGDEGFGCGKHDLPKKLKERNKELVEKCRAYLQRTKELTAQNRAFKDTSERALQENKKLQELLEHSKLRLLQVSRHVTELRAERTNVDHQSERVEELKKELSEDRKTINSLKQALSEKDRRIELIQHRKKRRRVMGSVERNMGVRETFYGYEEDNSSVASQDDSVSLSRSISSTASEEDWGDLNYEETERKYQRLAMEQLQLQKAHALLQSQVGNLQDPQREALANSNVQQDLFQSQCRIEQLEKLINEIGEGEVITLLKEREAILTQNKLFYQRIDELESHNKRLSKDLMTSQDSIEELEFRLTELEHLEEESSLTSSCETSLDQCPALGERGLVDQLAESERQQLAAAVAEMEQLRKDLATLLKGKGKEADAVLRKLDRLKDIEQNASALEALAHELQMKVITLQKEKDALQEELALKSVDLPRGDKPSSAARERQENLELKVEISRLVSSETKLADERNILLEQIDDYKTQYEHLKYQLDVITSSQQQLKVKVHECPSSGDSASESPASSPSQSSRKLSKDRKSKCRDEDDSTPQSKRRKSSDASEHKTKSMKRIKSFGDVKSINEEEIMSTTFKSTENCQPMPSVSDGDEKLTKKMKHLEKQLTAVKEENKNLLDQLKQSALEKSSEAEADQQMLLDRLRAVDTENDLLRQENETLALQLRQRVDEFQDSQDDISPRQCELEDYCEDLQERLHASESSERHLKEKLRLVEGSMDDAESSEMAIREEYEKLMTRETEAKNQLLELQRTGRELRDIILDKDIVEQALRDKVDFLQKAEAASVQRIEELEAIERDLREQLEVCYNEGSGNQRELNKIQELKHQLTFLETDNKALSGRVSELEENEEILRENWRRVADEDFNRTQTLEEKVKMLESVNKDLKGKLTDAQEYFVINTIPETSLASELAQSQTRTAAPFQGNDPDSKDSDSEGSETEEVGQLQTEQKVLKEKVWKLERKLSDVSEQKNTKIETLQEKIVSLKENEIKLSETISEMEMTEREIRAKLALYESSEVTVEKMLKYQSKIEELRTSQESLLDQLESMENQEMTTQEKMQEMERTLRGKIVTLEVEMKGCKTKELKGANRIRELEKQEKELTEKLATQAEKENGLYVKISALMDELKAVKEENENLNKQLSEKEDKIRKSKLLEVKLLEIEMEFGKKSSALNSKLRHKEEELRQKEWAHDEVLKSMRLEHSTKMAEQAQQQSQRTSILDSMYAQKESELQSTISSLEESVKDITCERDQFEKNMKDLADANELLKESSQKEAEAELNEMKENLEKEKARADEAETRMKDLEKELERERETVCNIETKMVAMKEDIAEKMKNIESSFVEKETEYEKEKQLMKDELDMKKDSVEQLERELERLNKRVNELEAECDKVKGEAASQEKNVSERVQKLERQMTQKESDVSELERQMSVKDNEVEELRYQITEKEDSLRELKHQLTENKNEHNQKVAIVEKEKEELEKELRNKVMFLNTQLLQEAQAREEQKSNMEQRENQEVTLTAELSYLKQNLEEKLSELEQQNKENCELSLELSQSRHNEETLQHEFDTARQNWSKTETNLKNELDERDQTIDKTNNDLKNLQVQFAQLESSLGEKEISLEEMKSCCDILQQKLAEQEQVVEEKCRKEVVAQEQMQKHEIMLQETGREKVEREAELNQLRAAMEEKLVLLNNSHSEKEDNKSKLEHSMSVASSLEEKVSQLESQLSQAQETLQLQSEQLQQKAQVLTIKDSEVEELQKKLLDKEQEVACKESEYQTSHSQILSQMSDKQQELDHAQEELNRCLQDIEQVKKHCLEKDQELQQQDQTFNDLLVEKRELTQKLEQCDIDTKSVNSKMAEVQQELKEVENRYRELEAKCASLELQLEERFASAQDAEKIVVSKQSEVQILEAKLMSLQKLYTESCADLQKFEVEYTDMQSRQIELEEQYTQSQAILEKQAMDCQRLEKEISELNDNCQTLKEQSSEMPEKVSSLESQVDTLRSALDESENQCLDMLSKVEEMTQTVKIAQEKCQEKEKQVYDMEKLLEETVNKNSFEEVESKLNDKEVENEVLALKLEEASENTGKLEARIADLADKLATAEQKLQTSIMETDQLQNTLSGIEKKLQEKESSNEATQSWFESLKQENLEFQIDCENLQKKLGQLQDNLDSKNEECEKSSEKIKDLEVSIQQTGQALQDNETELAEVLEKLLEEEAKSKDTQARLEHAQRSLAHSEATSQEFREEAEAMRSEVKKLKSENEELIGKCSRLTDSESEMTGLCNELKGKLHSLQSEKKDQVKEIENLKQDLSENEKQLSESRVELEDKHNQMTSMEDHHQVELQELAAQGNALQQENISKSELLEELQSKQEGFLANIRHLEDENDVLRTKVQTMESVLKASQLDGSDVMQVNENLRAQIEDLEKEIKEKVERCDSLEANMEENNMEREIALAEVKHLQGLNTQLNAEISGLHEELEDASREFDHIRNSFEEGKSNIEGEVNAVAQDKEEIEMKLLSLQNSYQEQGLKLEDTLKQLDDSSERLSELEQANRLAERTIDSLQKEKSHLISDKEDAEVQYSECHVKLSQERAQSKELEKKVDVLSVENLSLKKDIELLQKKEKANSGVAKNVTETEEENFLSFVSNIPTRRPVKDMSAELNYDAVPVDEEDICLSFVNNVSAPVPQSTILKDASEEVREDVPVHEDLIQPAAVSKKEHVAPVSVDDDDFFSFVNSIPQRREVKDVCEVVNYDVVPLEQTVNHISHTASAEPMITDSNDNEIVNVDQVDHISKVQELMNEISVYKEKDDAQQSKLNNLESSLNETQKREAKLSSRVEELEVKEKDLLEQMTDIEQTVIVPLEAENQELKDELRVVKQERDDAFAVAKVNEDDGEQDVESLRKSLEDSLLQRDELEKKVNILLEDIARLESERESLFQKISTFEVEKVENDEMMESLEEKVRRLPILEKQTTIVEESENILMDKVLDLEDKEQQLIAEVKELKEKLSYLQQKNEVLQDAEERYMNKIMELEESLHKVGSEMSILKSKAAAKESLPVEESFTTHDSESLSQVNGAKCEISTCHVSVDTSDLCPNTQDANVSVSEKSQVDLKSEKDNISAELKQKQCQLNSLQEKLVLLQDSEAGLMEKLLEAEEKLENSKAKISRIQSDLEKKIETLVEENEYLAGNVENYKQLYKEEKGKVNDLQEVLQDTQVELESTQTMVEDIQSEYEDQLANRDAQIAAREKDIVSKEEELMKLTEHHHQMEDELAAKDAKLVAKEADLTAKDTELKSLTEQHQQRGINNDEKQKEDKDSQTMESSPSSSARITELQDRIQYLLKQNDKLQNTVESQNQVEEDLRAQDKLRKQELQGQLDALTQRKEELRLQHKEREQNLQADIDAASLREQKLKADLEAVSNQLCGCSKELEEVTDREYKLSQELDAVSKREQTALNELDVLVKEIQESKQAVSLLKQDMAAQERRREFEQTSDSSQSVEELRMRYETTPATSAVPAVTQPPRAPSPRHTTPSPTIQQLQGIYESKASVTLSRPTSSSPRTNNSPASTSPNLTAKHPPIAPQDGRKTPSPNPVAPPRMHRKILSRPSSIESSVSFQSQEDLSSLVYDLQEREAALKKRVAELEADQKDSIQLSHRISELEADYQTLEASNQTLDATNQILERRVEFAESQSESLNKDNGRSVSPVGATRARWLRGDRGRTQDVVEEEKEEELNKELDRSFNSCVSMSSGIMLDKPEDVLQQRIKELERLDQHNKNQLSELERDREVLHEIARKDKATIHELNVKIRELQLSERSLREQVNSLESSESSLFSRCDELEATKTRLEDRVHELEIHERRLRELVRKLKLDEEQWLGKTTGMESAVAELSANEQQLKRLLQDVELERGGLTERAEYLEARIRELENVEVTLLQRVKNYENNEVTLQNQLVHLENSESAAQSKSSELDVINMDLSQRLQRAVEENAVLSQHATQLHGQVQDLDRRLMTSRDSELAYKQHVESLQKNESSLQKKVREYELREIDSQARIRELEQTSEITNDKLATLQRSENKLKYRVHELEGIGGQIPGELTPAQRQKVPQKLEDCQKRVLVLQSQVENLQLQLRQALALAHSANTSQEEDDNVLTVPKDDYITLQTKASLLDETTYQLQEVENLNEELNATILQLRQGKGASGHEVEIEVLKRRLDSYKTLMSKLKSSLSTGQATSLEDPEQVSGPEGDSLSARPLHGLASERVLQSVRGIHNGKADSHKQGDAQNLGLAQSEDSFVQSTAAETMSANLQLSQDDDGSSSGNSGPTSSREESHWRAIEARKPTAAGSSRGGVKPVAEGVTRVSHSARPTQSGHGGQQDDGVEEEEVTIGLHLPSESELSSYHRTTQNDTDSSNGPVAPPRRGRISKVVQNENNSVSSGSESSDGQMAANELSRTAAAVNKKHFAKDKSLPSPVRKDPLSEQWTLQQRHQQQQQAPLMSFGEDSFYLPSSVQEDLDSFEDDEAPPPLPSSGPPGAGPQTSSPGDSLNDSVPLGEAGQQDRRNSVDNDSTSGMSIRERIAHIEKQLQSDKSGQSDDEQVFYWKKKSSDALKQAEGLEKDNRHLKEDINRLEKELEEKRRHINILELWLWSIEDLMKNKDKKADREMIEQLQLDLTNLRRELGQAGYRGEDAVLDSAALKTELERREREIMSKKSEIDVISLELQRCRKERDSIEGMRRTALDSLRALERELVGLQDSETQLKQTQAQLKELHTQYDEMENYKNQAVNMIQPLQAQVDRLTRKCQEKDILLSRLGAELRRVSHRPSSALDDLTRLEQIMSAEEYNKSQAHPKVGERRAGHMRSSSMDDLDLNFQLSDAESVGGGASSGSPVKKQRPTPYVNNRPRSAEAVAPGQRAQRGTHAHSRWTAPHRARDNQQLLGDGVTRGQYVAIADYDPGLFSQSGRPGLELALREGDHVLVTGPMDQSGYYEAVVSGRSGLVPANYLQPLHLNGHHTQGAYLDHSPEQMMDLYRRLQHPESASGPSQGNTPVPRGSRPSTSMGPMGPVPNKKNVPVPDPPHHLHVKGIVNEKSILLSWLPPPMDAQGNSNGLKVLGYMVYLDNAEYEQLSNPGQCEVVVEGLSPDRCHRLAVQSLCAEGYVSPRAELVFEGMVKLGQSQVEGQGQMDTDLSSVLNSAQYKRGHKRRVMALYDYSPEQQSPHDYTALELPFHAGDLIYVYGEPRQDGFYHGEIDEKRGLVPACFVEDIAKLNRTQDKHKAPGYKSS